MRVDITNFGCTIVRLLAPDRDGVCRDVVLGFNTLHDYQRQGYSPYFGSVVGRVANRIANGRFAIDGVEYQLATNNEPAGIPCHLHGGVKGFDRRVWDAQPVASGESQGLR